MSKRTYGTGTVRELSKGRWECRYRGKSKTVQASTKKVAETLLAAWVKETDARTGLLLPMTRLFDLHVADLRRNNAASTKIVRQVIDKHLIPYFGDREAESIRKVDVTRYKDYRLSLGHAPASINNSLSYLRRSLNLSISEGLATFVPPIITDLRVDNVRKGFIERETYLAILRELPSHSQMVFCFAYHWGVRKGELLMMRWDWLLPYWADAEPIIKVPGHFQNVRITKSGEPHTLPIYSTEMRSFVEIALASRNPHCPYLFQKANGERLKDFRDGWEGACQRAGVQEIVFHDTRRTAIRLMERAGIPRAEAMQISGHKTESVYKRYDIASENGAIRAGQQMRDFHESEKLRDKLRDGHSAQTGREELIVAAKSIN